MEVTGLSCDIDIYVLDDTCDGSSGCLAGATNASTTTDSVTFSCVAGRTYYIVMEGYGFTPGAAGGCGSAGSYTFSFDVSASTGCPEDCDNGLDDDFDGDIDCYDSDCFGDIACDCDVDNDGWDGSLWGWCGGGDCDDYNAAVNPGATEVCNGYDDECDTLIDDDDPSLDLSTATIWYRDMDGDGYGDPLTATYQCNLPAGFVANNDDCDDTRPTIYPGAPEYCNLLDDDCDGVVDESPVVDGLEWYLDADGDSYGDPATVVNSCDAPAGYIWDNGDCDDANFAINPAAQEICDGLDNDCDGLIDAADISLDPSTAHLWYQDADGDGFGNPAVFIESCSPPDGYVEDNSDCDDTDAEVYPGAPEVPYDGIDQDCDGSDLTDVDGDGYDAEIVGGTDCDDTEATTNPAAIETADGVDEDCDDVLDEGTVWYDDDGDGFTEDGGDCDDAEPTINPAEREICDGIDEDCDEIIDEETECYDDDGDGYSEVEGDCDDTNAAIGPDAAEIFGNGIDDDCDGIVDNYATDADGDGYTIAGGDCDDANADIHPGAVELENGIDDDCDGVVDEGTNAFDDDGDGYSENDGDCNDKEPMTFPGAPEVNGNGVDDDCDEAVDEGTDVSDDDGDGFSEVGGDCDDANPAVHPGATEVENGLDDDCDGEADEGLTDLDKDGFTVDQGDCDDTDGWVFPDAVEMCDGADNDCNGETDEGCPTDDVGGAALPSCGCRAAPQPSHWWFAFALFGLTMARRRNREEQTI
jgi:MYXO-CTERM domain-containing protein